MQHSPDEHDSTCVCSSSIATAGGGLVSLPPKLKYETLLVSGVFVICYSWSLSDSWYAYV